MGIELTTSRLLGGLALLDEGVEDLREGPEDTQILWNGPLGLQGIQVQPQEAFAEGAQVPQGLDDGIEEAVVLP